MNILIASNEKYLLIAKNLLFSLRQYNSFLNIYLMYEDISDNIIEDFKSFLTMHDIGSLNLIKFNSDFIDLPLKKDGVTGHITKEAYFRLYAPFYLPSEMNRILYLDCDIICAGDISKFYYTDFGDNLLAGCINADVNNSLYLEKLQLPGDGLYINSGVLLFNLKEYRKFVSVDSLNSFISENVENLDFQDQSVINKMFYGRIKQMSIYYNFQIAMLLCREGGILIHYTGGVKPWDANYINPAFATYYYDVLIKLGENESARRLKENHILNFRRSEKLASIVVKTNKVLETDISFLLKQSEVNLEFIVVYNEADNELIDKFATECRLFFVQASQFNNYENKFTGKYVSYIDIDNFRFMDKDFLRELCYFADVNKLLAVFFDKFKVNFNPKIENYNGEVKQNNIIEYISGNSNSCIYIRNILYASKKIGYF